VTSTDLSSGWDVGKNEPKVAAGTRKATDSQEQKNCKIEISTLGPLAKGKANYLKAARGVRPSPVLGDNGTRQKKKTGQTVLSPTTASLELPTARNNVGRFKFKRGNRGDRRRKELDFGG